MEREREVVKEFEIKVQVVKTKTAEGESYEIDYAVRRCWIFRHPSTCMTVMPSRCCCIKRTRHVSVCTCGPAAGFAFNPVQHLCA